VPPYKGDGTWYGLGSPYTSQLVSLVFYGMFLQHLSRVGCLRPRKATISLTLCEDLPLAIRHGLCFVDQGDICGPK
jgi:hypothetical protein